MIQTPKRSPVEQTRFHKVERPFHLAFRLRATRSTRPGAKSVVRRKRQESRVVDRLFAVILGYHHLHVVVKTGGRHAAEMLEGPNVLADRGSEVLTLDEPNILTPRVAQDVAEQVDSTRPFLREIDRAGGIVHLGLRAGRRLEPHHRLFPAARSKPANPLFDDRVPAWKPLFSQFFEHPHRRDLRVTLQQGADRCFVRIQLAGAFSTRRR